MEAIVLSLLLHVPPAIPSDKVITEPTQTDDRPVITPADDAERTVIDAVSTVVKHALDTE